MQSSPYRLRAQTDASRGAARCRANLDVLAAAVLLWTVSFARVVGAVLRHEIFGSDATLALMAIVAIPWLLIGGHRGKRG